jgi:hypothetical protein
MSTSSRSIADDGLSVRLELFVGCHPRMSRTPPQASPYFHCYCCPERNGNTRACRVDTPSTRCVRTEAVRRHERRRGTHECVRHGGLGLLT